LLKSNIKTIFQIGNLVFRLDAESILRDEIEQMEYKVRGIKIFYLGTFLIKVLRKPWKHPLRVLPIPNSVSPQRLTVISL
jgi:hypothetical protein